MHFERGSHGGSDENMEGDEGEVTSDGLHIEAHDPPAAIQTVAEPNDVKTTLVSVPKSFDKGILR